MFCDIMIVTTMLCNALYSSDLRSAIASLLPLLTQAQEHLFKLLPTRYHSAIRVHSLNHHTIITLLSHNHESEPLYFPRAASTSALLSCFLCDPSPI